MKIKCATKDIIPEWLTLAKEVEDLFQGDMTKNKEFYDFMIRKIDKQEAITVVDNRNQLMGVITISCKYNRISWLAVFNQYRGQGIGSMLLEHGLNRLNKKKVISVVTFTEGHLGGEVARNLYKKFGFKEVERVIEHGQIRDLMNLENEVST